MNNKSYNIVQSNNYSYQKYTEKIMKFLSYDNRELNYQNSVIKPLLEQLYVNRPSISVVDVSTQYKNWNNRSWHDRLKYAVQHTPDILVATNWNIRNKGKGDIEYLLLIEVKSPTASDRKHAVAEVEEYLTLVSNVILTDGITWEFYNRDKNNEIEFFYLEKNCKRVCEQKNIMNMQWKTSVKILSDFLVNELNFPPVTNGDSPDEWTKLCDKLKVIVGSK